MKKLICIGDSNTYGFDPRSYLGSRYDQPWPELLAAETGLEVVNLGQNGMEIPNDDLELDFLYWKLQSELPADGITVMLGTNDLLNARLPDQEAVTRRMEWFLRQLKVDFPRVKLWLIAPPPVFVGEKRRDSASQRLGECYRQLARRLDIGFLDAAQWQLGTAFDGVHLTEEAHCRFAQHLQEVLR